MELKYHGKRTQIDRWIELVTKPVSLILLIMNEVIRNHGVCTMEEAIDLWKGVYRQRQLRSWAAESSDICSDVMASAVHYDVTLVKMMRTVPESERFAMVSKPDENGVTLLHCAAESGKIEKEGLHCILLPAQATPNGFSPSSTHWQSNKEQKQLARCARKRPNNLKT